MKSALARFALAAVLAGGLPVTVVAAEDGVKTLPTLLIKGEVVSLDTTDPSATLLKVKDRYGFETPIFLTQETTVTRGTEAAAASSLAAGTPVEVEYNFDVNTAKRHAVSVKLAAPVATEPAAQPAPAVTTPPAPTEPAPAAVTAPVEPAASQPQTEAPAPVTPDQPAVPAASDIQ